MEEAELGFSPQPPDSESEDGFTPGQGRAVCLHLCFHSHGLLQLDGLLSSSLVPCLKCITFPTDTRSSNFSLDVSRVGGLIIFQGELRALGRNQSPCSYQVRP